MTRTVLIVVSLLAGLCAGLVLRGLGAEGAVIASLLKPLGALWLNGLQMTLVPLVFCLMATGAASVGESSGAGRLIGLSAAVFLGLLIMGSVLGAAVAAGLLRLWPIHAVITPHAAAAPSPDAPDLMQQVMDLIPVNPVAAAARTAMAPLLVFAALFGAALQQLAVEVRAPLLGVLRAVGAALLVIVGWVLALAPVGVFVLAMGATFGSGLAAASGLAQYVLLFCAVSAIGLLVALGIGLLSGLGPIRFIRGAAGPAALAASTQSSMACLPALLQAAREEFGLPEPIVATIMPFAVTTFRFGNVFGGVAAGLIGARLFGVQPSLLQIALAIAIGVLSNIGAMGLPGAAVLLAAYGPIFAALGAPLEALTLLIAVFAAPDVIVTTSNVTADLSATALIARYQGRFKFHQSASNITLPEQAL